VVADPEDRTGGAGPKEPAAPEAWVNGLAEELGEAPLGRREVGEVLKLARDVAHGVERKLAPLAAFVAGVHVGRRAGEGASREEALAEATRAAASLLPERSSDPSPGSGSSGAD